MQVLSRPPSGAPALVLNADFRPLSYYPLSLWPWQETIKAVFLGRVDVVSTYDTLIHSPNFRDAPAQCRLAEELRRAGSASRLHKVQPFPARLPSPANTAAGRRTSRSTMSPRAPRAAARRGKTSSPPAPHVISARAGGRLKEAGMIPRRPPRRPTMYELQDHGRRFPPNHLHESWLDYLYWDIELEA